MTTPDSKNHKDGKAEKEMRKKRKYVAQEEKDQLEKSIFEELGEHKRSVFWGDDVDVMI